MSKLNTCECKQDGYCHRYQREMGGRMRELCAGVNVDLGTAAAFRHQWAREANWATEPYPPREPTPLLLQTHQAPGDTVAATAAIYSLHRAWPGRYLTAVDTNHPEVFEYNPDVTPHTSIPDALPLRMHYPAIHDSNDRGIHFMQGWCEFLSDVLEVPVPLLTNRPRLYFPEPAPDVEDFWLICSGGKQDFTNKLWGWGNYQRVVELLKHRVRFIQVGSNSTEHPRLRWTEDMVGKTTLRQLFDLCRRASGVVCGVSLLMHVAAALEKPAVVIAGGREPVQWNAYPRQQYLHTVGALPCSTPQGRVGGACWRSRLVPLGDGEDFLDKDTCQRPVGDLPQCMTMIEPRVVVELVMKYSSYGTR